MERCVQEGKRRRRGGEEPEDDDLHSSITLSPRELHQLSPNKQPPSARATFDPADREPRSESRYPVVFVGERETSWVTPEPLAGLARLACQAGPSEMRLVDLKHAVAMDKLLLAKYD